MKLVCVVGARPNLVKAAPLLEELAARAIECMLLHTGQHYDHEMDRVFFDELRLRDPDHHLGVGSGTHGVQTAAALVGVEEWLQANPVAAVLAIGDVNSTLAAALAATKLHVPVVHVEAGYRSGDMQMPEEINRVVTDHISTLLLAPTRDAVANLQKEGVAPDRISFSGNIMAQTFLLHLDRALAREPWSKLGLAPRDYILATIHRPENADDARRLETIVAQLQATSQPIVWPVHPRLKSTLTTRVSSQVRLTQPLPYLDLIGLAKMATCIVTDSGGVQEEACLSQVPCVTVRTTTERKATIDVGANRLSEPDQLREAVDVARAGPTGWPIPERWDQDVAARMADAIAEMA